jgi:hypothetical protein
MHNAAIRALILMASLGANAQAVHAAQPPDSVKSDDNANTAMGTYALLDLSSGTQNTAAGDEALLDTASGDYNTGMGAFALWCNQSGSDNTALGQEALQFGVTGDQNTGIGAESLSNNNGSSNTAIGFQSAYATTSGVSNTALGRQALLNNTSGKFNIGVGDHGGQSLTTGSYNIDIGSDGVGGDNGKIRIGAPGSQTAAYIAGISTTQLTGAAVYVTSSGQLGVLASSERYKTAIAPMGLNTDKLLDLRPVTFHLKTDPQGAVQYGLIAEEVDKVYPELVIRDDAGKIQGVRYDELAPMLLNEVQQQQQRIADQQQRVARQDAQIQDLKRLVLDMQAGLATLQSKAALVAQR